MNSDLKPICQKCQEIFYLKPSSYFVCNICDSFRHKLNRLDIFLSKTFNLHVTRGHLRSHSVAVKVFFMLNDIVLYKTYCFPDRNRSLECLVKKTELLENPSNGNCKYLPLQDHFDQINALRSRSVNPQQKDQAEELFPSTIEVGFILRRSFANLLIFYPQICGAVK